MMKESNGLTLNNKKTGSTKRKKKKTFKTTHSPFDKKYEMKKFEKFVEIHALEFDRLPCREGGDLLLVEANL